jgi:DNA-binding transcriptional LysR family regulator
MGISIVPKSYVSDEMERGTLQLVRVRNFKLIRKLGLIHRKKRYMSRASKAFLEVVEESLGKKSML